jgi:hypothetical protein
MFAHLLAVTLPLLVIKVCIFRVDLLFPPCYEIGWQEQRAVSLADVLAVYVPLPMRPTLMFNGRQFFY